jgi:hypothetical protein
MKPKYYPLSSTLLGLILASTSTASLDQATPVHASASVEAAVIKVLPAGSPRPAPAPDVTAPAGWQAVLLPPPHDVFVENRSITKDLSVSRGASLRLQPEADAITLDTAEEEDELEITGLRGRWTQLRLNRPVVGYITAAPAAPVVAPSPSPAPSRIASTPVADSPAGRPAAPAATRPSSSPPAAASVGPGLDAMPRTFEGTIVSTRAPLRPRRPFDYALEDRAGNRLAYLDFTRLMLTSPISDYVGRRVIVYGPARTSPEIQVLVIRVESLQLR